MNKEGDIKFFLHRQDNRDFVYSIFFMLVAYVIAIKIELFDFLHHLSKVYHLPQIDGIVSVLIIWGFVASWYIYRRMVEIRTLNQDLAQKVTMLLSQESLIKEKNKDLSFFKEVIENSHDEIYLLDEDSSYILYANQTVCGRLGFAENDLLQMKATDIITTLDTKAKWDEAVRTLRHCNAMIVETSHKRGDGECYPVESSVKRIESLERGYVVVIARDITERMLHESQMKEKEDIMIAQSRLAAMGEMIGNIAHQWRQPLSSVGMAVQNMLFAYESGKLDRTYLEQRIDKIMKQITYMSKTIDDFRGFFHPSREKLVFNVSKQLEGSIEIIHAALVNHGIRVELTSVETNSSEKDQHCYLLGFQNEFSQVILNLLQNAKDAISENRVQEGWIKVILNCQDPHQVMVEIRDNGGGISQDYIDKVFDPYFTTKGQNLGTGIGLYMSKVIVEKHFSGKLSVKNDEHGAVFSMVIPKNRT